MYIASHANPYVVAAGGSTEAPFNTEGMVHRWTGSKKEQSGANLEVNLADQGTIDNPYVVSGWIPRRMQNMVDTVVKPTVTYVNRTVHTVVPQPGPPQPGPPQQAQRMPRISKDGRQAVRQVDGNFYGVYAENGHVYLACITRQHFDTENGTGNAVWLDVVLFDVLNHSSSYSGSSFLDALRNGRAKEIRTPYDLSQFAYIVEKYP